MANTAIYVRSPKILSVTGTANQATTCELYLWNSPDSIPTLPTKTLSKPVPSSVYTTVYYDISEYCREYINNIKYTEVTIQTAKPVTEYCFCTAKIYLAGVLQTTYTFICFDGYGYFEDGWNPSYDDVLMTEGTYQVKENANSGGLTVYNDGTVTWYVKYNALSMTGTTYSNTITDVMYTPYLHDNFKGTGGNVVQVYRDAVLYKTFTFLETCEPKYTPLNVDFVNKYGAWQRIMFFKASYLNFDVSNNEYNLMSSTPNYNVNEARRKTFNTQGMEKIRANTGWVDESYNDVIKQMMLSETILVDDQPVRLNSKSVELQKSINKKLINYEVTFDVAHMVINTVQ